MSRYTPINSRMRFLFCMFLVISVPNILFTTANADENDQIEFMEYFFEYRYKDSEEKTSFRTSIQLEINHTGFEFPGNGTIKYYAEDLIQAPRLLLLMSQVFPSKFVNFFLNHETNEFYQTYYYNRTESNDPNFNTSNYLTPFWMHETLDEIINFQSFGRVYFFNSSSPSSLAIDDIVTISHGTKRWSDSFGGKLFDTHTVTCFVLSLDVFIGDDVTFAHIYYDRATGMLMYGHLYFKQVNESGKTIGEIKIHHVTSTFSISQKINGWLFAMIGVLLVIAFSAGWMVYSVIKNGKKKKPSRLDQI